MATRLSQVQVRDSSLGLESSGGFGVLGFSRASTPMPPSYVSGCCSFRSLPFQGFASAALPSEKSAIQGFLALTMRPKS